MVFFIYASHSKHHCSVPLKIFCLERIHLAAVFQLITRPGIMEHLQFVDIQSSVRFKFICILTIWRLIGLVQWIPYDTTRLDTQHTQPLKKSRYEATAFQVFSLRLVGIQGSPIFLSSCYDFSSSPSRG